MAGRLRGKAVALLELGAMRRVPLAMADAEILPHKGAIAVREVASVDLLGGVWVRARLAICRVRDAVDGVQIGRAHV